MVISSLLKNVFDFAMRDFVFNCILLTRSPNEFIVSRRRVSTTSFSGRSLFTMGALEIAVFSLLTAIDALSDFSQSPDACLGKLLFCGVVFISSDLSFLGCGCVSNVMGLLEDTFDAAAGLLSCALLPKMYGGGTLLNTPVFLLLSVTFVVAVFSFL